MGAGIGRYLCLQQWAGNQDDPFISFAVVNPWAYEDYVLEKALFSSHRLPPFIPRGTVLAVYLGKNERRVLGPARKQGKG